MPDTTPPTTKTPPSYPAIQLNWEDWLPLLENSNAPEADKRQLIEVLWSILSGFADLGWDIAPSGKPSGQVLDLTTVLRAAVLNSEEPTTNEEDAA